MKLFHKNVKQYSKGNIFFETFNVCNFLQLNKNKIKKQI